MLLLLLLLRRATAAAVAEAAPVGVLAMAAEARSTWLVDVVQAPAPGGARTG